MAYKGRYKVINPEKYLGDPEKITYRSSWERRCMYIFDNDDNVLEWQSEPVIMYRCMTDMKIHKYYVDFYVKVRLPDGSIEKRLLEVKPKKQTKPPVRRGRKSKKVYLKEQHTWLKNKSKWKAAQDFADEHGMKFYLVTEKTLFGK